MITGGSRGIGAASFSFLASQGMDIAFAYNRNEEQAAAVAEAAGKTYGVRTFYQRCEVTSLEGCKTTVAEAIKNLGGLGVLINNAGFSKDQTLMAMMEEQWTEVIDTNLNGCFDMTRSCIVTLLRQKSSMAA